MKEVKPDWYDTAKEGWQKPMFTEQMKQEVSRRIQHKQPTSIRRKYGLWTALTAAVAVCGIAIILSLPTLSKEQRATPSDLETPMISFTPSPTPTAESSPPVQTQSPNQEVKLTYEDPLQSLDDYPVETNRIEAARVAKSSIIVKRVIEVDELGNYLIYVKQEGDTLLYAGMEILTAGADTAPANDLYEIGPIGELTYIDDIEITKSNLFGQFHIRIYGVCGANCVTNNWIHFEEQTPGVPISDFRLFTHVQEVDLDEDGVPEVIATESSTIGKAQIYKKDNDQVKFVDLNVALQAEHPNSVIYDNNTLLFTAIFSDHTLSYQYKNGADELFLVDDSRVQKETNNLILGDEYTGEASIQMQIDGASVEAKWFKDPFLEFGLYLPPAIKKVKFEDGYEYASDDGQAIINLSDRDEASLPYLRKQDDLKTYSDYVGSEFWGDDQSIRYDYFLYDDDPEQRIYISIRYKTDKTEQIRPLLLAVVANVRYAPEID